MFCLRVAGVKALRGILTVLLLSAQQIASAQESKENASDGGQWTLGLVAYGVSSPYDREAKEEGVFPYIAYRNDWISIDPNGVALKAFSEDHCSVELLAAPRFLITEPSEIERYADMDRDIGLDLGARAGCDLGGGFASSLSYKADVSDTSNGHEIDAAISKNFVLAERVGLDIRGGTYWRDNNLSRYLYGVFDDEAQMDRPAYAPGSSFVPYASVAFSLNITKHLTAVTAFETEIYSKNVNSSPIIDREAIGTGTLSLFYNF